MNTENEQQTRQEVTPRTEAPHGPPVENEAEPRHVPFATADELHHSAVQPHTTGEHAAADEHAHDAGHNKEAARRADRFKTVLSLLMALVVVSGAVITWRATLDTEDATKEDAVGLTATVQQQGARVESNASTYQHYEAFTNYALHQGLGDQIAHQMQADAAATPGANTQAQLTLEQQAMTDEYAQAFSSRPYFPSRYLDSNGNYDTSREVGATLADKAKSADLQPDKHFEEADKLRGKSNALLLALLILGASLLCYTLIGGLGAKLSRRLQWPLVSAGLLLTLIAIADALRVEFFT